MTPLHMGYAQFLIAHTGEDFCGFVVLIFGDKGRAIARHVKTGLYIVSELPEVAPRAHGAHDKPFKVNAQALRQA